MIDNFKYQCVDCGTEYSGAGVRYLCPACSCEAASPPKGVLKIIYDYDELIRHGIQFEHLKNSGFLDILPIKSIESLPPLKTGNTPLYRISHITNKKLSFELFLKDDSQNPTFSFKDRASSLVSACAKEHGFETIITASTGNAGSSMAGICASQGQKAIVVVPSTTPKAKLTQIIMYGALIIPVTGTYDDAFELSTKASGYFGWYNRNTAFNPITIEGKKTVAFELYDQLNTAIPDRIFVPVGDGVIISGIFKGFEDLLKMGIINNMPEVVAVQAEGSDNLVRNLGNMKFDARESSTIADSISVKYPRNFYMTRKFINDYGGESVTVADDDILKASSHLASHFGIFAEPAAAAAFAGFLKYFAKDSIVPSTKNVVLLTGSGLKDIEAVQPLLKIPEPVEPDIKEIEKLLNL